MLVLALAGLSSYLCRVCPMCVSLSRVGVVSTPPQYLSAARNTNHTATSLTTYRDFTVHLGRINSIHNC